MRVVRTVLLPLTLAAASLGHAEIRYRLTPLVDAKRIRVEMTVPVQGRETVVQMPRWQPGWYSIQNQTKDLKDLVARDAAGMDVGAVSVDDHTWRVPGGNGGTVRISYTLPVEGGAAYNLSGPALYMYVVGRKEEACHLSVDLPSGWQVAVGLKGEGSEYDATDYDVLADNPVTLGKFRQVRYFVQGKPHILTFLGPKADAVDGRALAEMCRRITETQTAFFGDIPYDKYVWHFTVNEGENWAGGLEHLSSTQIDFGQKPGWRTYSVFSHEFFHLWNVKRIRSKPLGPFDYQKIPRTGALWWLEGVTDYYAGLLLRRNGVYDDATYFTSILDSIGSQRGNPARFEVSAYQASENVAEVNNSTGFKISYYDTGYLIGLCLDMEIRKQTNNRRNLDDVMRNLYRICKGKPGFEEDEIRRQLVLEGGEPLGAMYDQLVLKPGELPLEKALGYAGLKLDKETKPVPARGFETKMEENRPVVVKVDGASEIKPGDVILMSMRELNRLIRNSAIGATVEVKVRREGEEITVKHTVASEPAVQWKITEMPNPTPEQKQLRHHWLFKTGRDERAFR
jgi:predicted metalloprotease with PDZ domain